MAGHCGTSAEALAILERSPVDVVLLDYDLGDDHASRFIDSARRAGFSGKILMVTAGMNAARIFRGAEDGRLRHLLETQFAQQPGAGHPHGGRGRDVGGSARHPMLAEGVPSREEQSIAQTADANANRRCYRDFRRSYQ